MLSTNLVHVKKSNIHGWGLFAGTAIRKHDIITQSPGIVFGIGSYCPTEICTYTFPFPAGGLILPLGYPSLINSSTEPNSEFEIDVTNKLVVIKALKDIQCDEEITLQYMG